MNRPLLSLAATLASLCICCGCGEKIRGPARVATYPVEGVVLVDGQPVGNLAVNCIRQSEPDKQHPTLPQCFTEDSGRFKIGTYESKDGVPEGDYAITFQWGEFNLFSRVYEGDKLNGRYSDPAASPVTFKVTKGKPVDLGTIKLTTK
jgi:hypothetical protein